MGTYETKIRGERFIYNGELNKSGLPCGKGVMKNNYGLDTVYGTQYEGIWLDGNELIVACSRQNSVDCFEYRR